MTIHMPKVFLLNPEVLLRALYYDSNNYQRKRNCHQCYYRHLPADSEHHHENTNDGHDRVDHLGNSLSKCLIHYINIVRDS